MKSFKLICIVAMLAITTMLGFTSCSNDMEPQAPTREGMVDVIVSTSLPQELQSYALNSAEGGLKNLEGQNLTVRYIMEIYTKDSKTLVERKFAYRPLDSEKGDYRTASFETRLLASEYNFVFWADIVNEEKSLPYGGTLDGIDNTSYYANNYFISNTDETSDILYRPISAGSFEPGDLKTIYASRLGNPIKAISPEMYDGYSCTEFVDLRTEATTKSFTLKRPFAKLRIITTDADKLQASPDWSNTSAVVKSTAELPTVFNAVTGEAETREGITGYWNLYTIRAGKYSEETESQTDRTLGVFYFPKPAKSQNMKFAFGIYDDKGNSLAEDVILEVENVPLVANKLTTIKGNILSKNTVVTVEIKDEFEPSETTIEVNKEASSPEELIEALSGETQSITYTSPVTKENGLEIEFPSDTRSVAKYDEGNNAVLTIKIPNIENGAVITIKGGANVPKQLVLDTKGKCSLRVNAEKADILLLGEEYGILLYNCAMLCEDGCSIDSFLYADNNVAGFFYPSNSDFDRIILGADFSISNATCKKHKNGCDLITKINNWLSENQGETVWDYVGATATMSED